MSVSVVLWREHSTNLNVSAVRYLCRLDQVSVYHVCLCEDCLNKGVISVLKAEPVN